MRRRAASVFFVATAVAASSCRSPTQITVRVRTDFECAKLAPSGVALHVAADLGGIAASAASSTSSACEANDVGSVVLVPSDHGDRVAIEIVAALAPTTLDADGRCPEGSAGCIHARRSLTYLAHESLLVPITLQTSCAGVICDPTQTCVSSHCVDATVDPHACEPPNGCPLDGGGGADAGADAPSESGDAGDSGSVVAPLPAVATCDVTALQVGAAWPMEGYCPGMRWRSPLPGPTKSQLRELWHYGTPQPVHWAAIDAFGNIYFATYTAGPSELHSITSGGALRWKRTDAPVQNAQAESTPTIDANGVLHLGTDDQMMLAIKTSDGSDASPARTMIGRVRSSSIVGGDGSMLFSDAVSEIVNMSSGGGVASRATATGSLDFSTPLVTLAGVVVMAGDGSLNGFDAHLGNRWTQSCAAATYTHSAAASPVPSSSPNVIGLADTGKAVCKFDVGTKTRAWIAPLPDQPQFAAVADDGTAFVAAADSSLYAVSATGTVRSPAVGAARGQHVIDAEGRVWVFSGSSIDAYDATTLAKKSSTPFARGAQSIVVSHARTLVVLGPDGVTALGD